MSLFLAAGRSPQAARTTARRTKAFLMNEQ
jgi:hypothetical protein